MKSYFSRKFNITKTKNFECYRNHSFSIAVILSEIPLSILCNTNGKLEFFDNVSITAILSGIHLILHVKLSEICNKKVKSKL